ncbi:heparinase II/III-family protein [bacterium]|nr:heparinase II/III-family protein [bacterium]
MGLHLTRPSSWIAVAALFVAALTTAAGCSGHVGADRADNPYAREIVRRAQDYLGQKRLRVDYYRIHRSLAYPLPVARIDNPPVPVEDSSLVYPWEIWMLWELEERVGCLGWAGELSGEARFREAAERDLAALAGWPTYNAQAQPHLSVGHAARTMYLARRNWGWLSSQLKDSLAAACGRLVDNHSAWLQAGRLGLTTPEQVLSADPQVLHNIPVIATLGLCLAARAGGHPLLPELERHCLALVQAELDLRARGLTEGLSYDGYILDFVADWLRDAPEESRRAVLGNPQVARVLSQAVWLAASGCLWRFAPFDDVEPLQMPFHADAQAKLLGFRPDSLAAWYLEHFPVTILRADGLAALAQSGFPRSFGSAPPAPGASAALYAVVLRTGWEPADLAVAASASNATAGHIQCDNGSLVLGTRGLWLIDDPGYQQYLSGEERDFTLGPGAHNYPVVNGLVQTSHRVERLVCRQEADSLWHTRLEFTAAYDSSLALERVTRDIWLCGRSLVVVADRVKGAAVKDIRYTWQGCPEAAWWPQDGAWLVSAAGAGLWVQSPGNSLDGGELYRHPGTRGQMSLCKTLPAGPDNRIWWVFSLGDSPAECSLAGDGTSLRVQGQAAEFALED